MARRVITLAELRSANLIAPNQRTAARMLGIAQSTLSESLSKGRVSDKTANKIHAKLDRSPSRRAEIYAGGDVLRENPSIYFRRKGKNKGGDFKQVVKNYRKARKKPGFHFTGEETSGRKLFGYA